MIKVGEIIKFKNRRKSYNESKNSAILTEKTVLPKYIEKRIQETYKTMKEKHKVPR